MTRASKESDRSEEILGFWKYWTVSQYHTRHKISTVKTRAVLQLLCVTHPMKELFWVLEMRYEDKRKKESKAERVNNIVGFVSLCLIQTVHTDSEEI